PLEFLSFRERLEAASGFQSAQFRELEFVLGVKRRGAVFHFPEATRGRKQLERRFEEPSLWDAFLAFLNEAGYAIPAVVLDRDVTQSVEPSALVQGILMEVYRTDPATAALC
ncbi:MAG: tryptophan 2,3-dioxygenase, partial [Gemmatimonadetes bacterium]|nr:tryptophan 2,3-dioxygenase [Gemmatimonadota bacterium]